MAGDITVVGIGPGSGDYLTPAAQAAIAQAQVLVGGARALAAYARPGVATKVIDRDLPGVLDFIARRGETQRVAVLVSGDPGFYSLLPLLRRHFPPPRLRVIPGISALQLAFARLGEAWQDAALFSFHGRDVAPPELVYRQGRKMAFLTDSQHTPQYIARLLRRLGWPNVPVAVCARLSYPEEQIRRLDLAAACELADDAPAVMVVLA